MFVSLGFLIFLIFGYVLPFCNESKLNFKIPLQAMLRQLTSAPPIEHKANVSHQIFIFYATYHYVRVNNFFPFDYKAHVNFLSNTTINIFILL